MILSYQSYLTYGSESLYQANKSNILDYSNNKDKSRNTETTRYRSASANMRGDNESFRSAHSKSVKPEIQEQENMLPQNSVNSGQSYYKEPSVAPTSEHQIIDKLLNYIMKEKNIEDKDKLLEVLMNEDTDLDSNPKLSGNKKNKREKDSLLMESVLHNQHSTSYKEIHPDDSNQGPMLSADVSKVNMTEDMGLNSFLLNDKKKQAKDKKFLSKLIDRSTSSQKKVRPKSSKGIRSNHVKVNTMSNVDSSSKNIKSRNVANYLNANTTQSNRLKSKQNGRKKTGVIGVRPNSGKDNRNLKSFHRYVQTLTFLIL